MEIRLIKHTEYQKMCDFINNSWKKNHALVKSKMLLDYLHLDHNYYNYYAAFDEDEIIAILGFIPTSLFDKQLEKYSDCWGAIWKVKEDTHYHGVGLELLEKLVSNQSLGSFGAIGISSVARKIYKLYDMKIGYLKHYYIANRNCDNFSIGVNLEIDANTYEDPINWSIITNLDICKVTSPEIIYRPYKTLEYFINKYAIHPVYKYTFWGIYQNDRLISVWVVRRIIMNQSAVFRVVDVLGNMVALPNLIEPIQRILKNESCEYLDLMNFGIEENVFERIGFTLLDIERGDAIVPNYFEPYEQRNVKIELAYKADFNYVAFKGDSDQDRPNIL